MRRAEQRGAGVENGTGEGNRKMSCPGGGGYLSYCLCSEVCVITTACTSGLNVFLDGWYLLAVLVVLVVVHVRHYFYM